MITIYFKVYGDPIGKGRPRFSRHGGYVRTYTPLKTVFYEDHVAHFAKQAMVDMKPFDGPVEVKLLAVKEIPKSYPKKKRQLALDNLIIPFKPDVDNIAKSVLDAMEGICYETDVMVNKLSIEKRFGELGFLEVFLTGSYLE